MAVRKPDRGAAATGEEKPAGEAALRAYMDEASQPGRTKRTAVRLALSMAMRDGVLGPGDMLPPEKELTQTLGVSLGTVQAALRQLQEVGAITRRRGDGSRVSSTEPIGESIWHFRFVSLADGRPFTLINEQIEVATTQEQGPWTAFLGEAADYLRIRRIYSAKGLKPVGAEMFPAPRLAEALRQLPPDELMVANIRSYLQDRYGLFARGASQTVKLVTVDETLGARFEMAPGQTAYEIHAETMSHSGEPIYFQRIYVPTSDYALNFYTAAAASAPPGR